MWAVARGSSSGGEVAEGFHVVVELRGGAGGDGGDGFAAFGGAGVDLVVDVGDVADVGDARIEAAEEAGEDVEDDHAAGVADMGEVIDGGSADVEADVVGVERGEVFAPAGHAVVEMEGRHGAVLRRAGPGRNWR